MHQVSSSKSESIHPFSRLVTSCGLAAGLALSGCGGGGGGGGGAVSGQASGAHLVSIQQGKLIDVYGLRTLAGSR